MPDTQADRQPDAQPTSLARGADTIIAAALVYLAVRLVYLALHIDAALPPDEVTHVGFARHYVGYWGLAADTPASHVHGLISHRPFLYSWLLARWLQIHLAIASQIGPDFVSAFVSSLVWMRLFNIALAFGTVAAGVAFARRAGTSAGACAMFVIVLTNLPMWSFLSASVNYDNAAMALATACFALLARYVDAPSARNACWLGVAALAGVLTKTAFVPLAFLIGVAALCVSRGKILSDTLRALRSPRATGVAVVGLSLVLGALAVGIYGRNVVQFGLLEPAPNQVLELEAANQNRIFRQEHTLRSFRAGAIDFRQAAAEISEIDHEGDRAGAMWMLRRAQEMREGSGEPLVGRLAYAARWTSLMAERLFGVMGHRELYKSGALAASYAGCTLLGLGALAWRVRRSGVHLRTAALVSAAYALILMQGVNYPNYVASGIAEDAVQGRYLFPVLAPLIAACCIAVSELVPTRFRLPLGLAVGSLFVLGDFPYFLANAGADWFGTP